MGGVSSESQVESRTDADGCDHILFSDVFGHPVRVKWARTQRLNQRKDRFWFRFCPDCGAKLNHDALFPPSTKP